MELFAATADGLSIIMHENGAWKEVRKGLTGRNVTSVIAREGAILAGSDDGLFRSFDRGASWEPSDSGLTLRHVRWLANHPDVSDREFAGVEPAGIFYSLDGGDSWQEAEELSEWRQRFRWFLPYSPSAGCVRGFAFNGHRGYAAVEVGAALRSDDGGIHWRLAGGSDGIARFGRPAANHIHPDVHSIAVHPSSPDLVIAPTGGGLYRSDDGGETWRCIYECYCRALWLDPADPAHLVFGPADSVDRGGRIEESVDGGKSWRRLGVGLATPWPRHMPERLTQVEDQLFAVLSNGELVAARIGDWQWQPVTAAGNRVQAVTYMAA
jgi:photosystem II stability/assembly factor-like uncharacterized protein